MQDPVKVREVVGVFYVREELRKNSPIRRYLPLPLLRHLLEEPHPRSRLRVRSSTTGGLIVQSLAEGYENPCISGRDAVLRL